MKPVKTFFIIKPFEPQIKNVICKVVEKLENPFVFRKHCNWIIFFQLSWFECLYRKNFWYIVLNDYEYDQLIQMYSLFTLCS